MTEKTSEYVIFVRLEENPAKKTMIWRAVSRDGSVDLGFVKWFGRWRKYTFQPAPGTIFDHGCLIAIADFCLSKTQLHMQIVRSRTPGI